MVAEGIAWRDEWARLRREGTYHKAIWGHGGTAIPATADSMEP